MTPEDRFRAYMKAFNESDWPALMEFYSPDIRLVIGNGTELVGRDAIVRFYTNVKSEARRVIEIVECFSDGNLLAAELESEFVALDDIPRFSVRPMQRGDRYYINSFVIYESDGAQYTRIRSAVLKREYRPVGSQPA